MTLNKYRSDYSAEPWYIDPVSILAKLPGVPNAGDDETVETISDWFLSRYGNRELIYDAEEWAASLTGFMSPLVAHWDRVLRAYMKANETVLSDFKKVITIEEDSTATPGTTTRTTYLAPNGTPTTAYSDGLEKTVSEESTLHSEKGTTETATDADTASRVAEYAEKLAFLFVRCLDSFEPLFLGVF